MLTEFDPHTMLWPQKDAPWTVRKMVHTLFLPLCILLYSPPAPFDYVNLPRVLVFIEGHHTVITMIGSNRTARCLECNFLFIDIVI